ncbi:MULTISPECIES: nucleotidyltransferase [Pseudomonas]|uniref:Nucleotidyltransferase n=1 Tax=Pseudomonas wuhanensis TaxID=2954098 RepID=A0ABY9GU37_9PSED|nr:MULTISPECIES: nucleotidyltransferase [unclassified Pseudomonas]WLI13434.1 nucleotidyltransferase [Pseudomonas sp. FP603]WLI19321.1 nucleotidyltransferase [Pseudomonas sp. FP607]
MLLSNEQTKRNSWEYFLLRAARDISLSEAQYEKINDRYSQLEKILSASDNPLLAEAHIFVQGSMRLKTTIKPIPGAPADLDTIDADAIIWLPHAQGASAKEILDAIEERFRKGSRVQEEIKQLRRGIRIVYSDENPGFHIDVTPARAILGNGKGNGEGKLEVPDRVTGWKASSPIPYSNWLQVASAQVISLEESLVIAKSQRMLDEATQAPLPQYEDYIDQDPLRATIKLLKRHRDEWAIKTKSADTRPISAVITTLATHAYLDVVKESKSKPLPPLDAILEIVRRMPEHIAKRGTDCFVCNPADTGENFAEKWNRPGEGQGYRQAFAKWHADASASVSLGLESFESTDSFAKAVKENFGMAPAFITAVNNEIPANWTMPGRPDGTTRNAASMGALFGGASGGGNPQSSVKPVGRLG